MSTTQLNPTNPLPLPGNSDNLLSLWDTPQRAKHSFGLSHLLQQLSHKLQTSLDIDEVLSQFSHEIKPFVAHDYLGYNHEHKGYDFSVVKARAVASPKNCIFKTKALAA
jgi:hypothetical protein